METFKKDTERIKELTALYKISKSMHTLDLNELLRLILEGVTKAIGFDRARLYLINEKDQILECKMAVGIEKEKIEGINLPLDKNNSMVATAVVEKKSFIVKDAINDPRVNRKLKELFGLKSFAVVSLIGKEKILGVVTADNLSSNRLITQEKFQSLVTFATQAGLALENAKMYKELKSFNEQLEERVKVATENLRKTQEKLIHSEKLAALGKLSAAIAHEIRNPLTSIKVLIHSLREKTNSGQEKDLEVVEEELERVNQIIKRFLDFSRPPKPAFSMVEINEILKETIEFVNKEAEEKNIKITT